MTDYVYLLHFSTPISARHTCQHYLGSAEDVAARVAEHQAGLGARLTQVAVERGISFRVVRVWEAPGRARQLERKLKQQKQGPDLCPLCRARRQGLDLVGALSFTLDDVPELEF